MKQTIPFSKETGSVKVMRVRNEALSYLGYINVLSIAELKGLSATTSKRLKVIAKTVWLIYRTNRRLLLVSSEVGKGGSKVIFKCRALNEKNYRLRTITFQTHRKTKAFREGEYALLRSLPKGLQVVEAPRILFEVPKISLGLTQRLYDCDGFTFAHGKYSQEQRIYACDGVLLGLNQLHSNGIIHRDLKPANILFRFENGVWPVAYIADLEYAKKKTSVDYLQGTPDYFAPEIATKKEMNQKTDTWAVGMTAYAIFTKSYPFNIDLIDHYGFRKALPMITQEQIDFSIGTHSIVFGKRWFKHLKQMLQVNPKSRSLPKAKPLKKG